MKKILSFILIIVLVLNINVFAKDNDNNYYFGLAVDQEKNLNYSEAINNFTQAINLKETYYEYLDRGDCYFNTGKFDLAIKDYTASIKLVDKSILVSNSSLFGNSYFNRGSAYFNLKDYVDAIKDYTIYIFLVDNNAQSYINRGSSYSYLGLNSSAIEDYKQALVIEPNNAEATKYLASSINTSSISNTPITPPDNSLTAPDTVESRIDGEFDGWTGDSIFKLQNGQIWEQSVYAYYYHYAYSPKVTIYKSGSIYKMKVDGVTNTITVKRIK
jgi:tetratricopeptide (TPR) repeat protein